MKKCLAVLLVLSGVFLQAPAQGYHPFPDSNATWCGERGYLLDNPLDTSEYHTYQYQQYLDGDTLIGGTSYARIYENGLHEWAAIPPYYTGSLNYDSVYQGGYREMNKEIWFIPPSDTNEYLLYDFNIGLLDTLPLSFYNGSANGLVVTGVDSVFDGAGYRRRLQVSTADTSQWPFPGNFEYMSLIEGVGSTHGLLWWLRPYFEMHGFLASCEINGNAVYADSTEVCLVSGVTVRSDASKDPLAVYPNPNTGSFTVAFHLPPNRAATLEVFDLHGRRVVALPVPPSTEVQRVRLPAGMANGIYQVVITSGGYRAVRKVVVIRGD